MTEFADNGSVDPHQCEQKNVLLKIKYYNSQIVLILPEGVVVGLLTHNNPEISSRSPGPWCEFVAEAKQNNILYIVYTWPAVCTVADQYLFVYISNTK